MFRIRYTNSVSRCYRSLFSSSTRTIRNRTCALSIIVPIGLSIKNRFVINCQSINNATNNADVVGSRLLYYERLGKRPEETRGYLVGFVYGVFRYIRICIRTIQLLFIYGPLLITYPLVKRSDRLMRRWRNWTLFWVERSGPAIVKFFQWASTRRDLFSKEFCDLFTQLHAHTSYHGWNRTELELRHALGPNWRSYFIEFDEQSCGSGCVAQVHKARLNYIAIQRAPQDIKDRFEKCDMPWVDVAIKVTHRGMKRAIADDLAILSGLVGILRWIKPKWQYIDPQRCLDEFRTALIRQIDMRYEGDALRIFSKQFENDDTVHFPKPIFQTEDVLIETFEDGNHISEYLDTADLALKEQLAKIGMNTLLKMVFVNNFVHGDLHPGNILVQYYEHKTAHYSMRKWLRDLLRIVAVSRDGLVAADDILSEKRTRLVFLDAGISMRLTETDLKNLRSVFKAVVDGDGAKAGELILLNAPQQRCLDPSEFVKDVDALVNRARSTTVTLRTMDVSSLLSDLLSTVSRHRVNLEPNFTCIVLAVVVLEGLGRALYPQLDLVEQARPVLLHIA